MRGVFAFHVAVCVLRIEVLTSPADLTKGRKLLKIIQIQMLPHLSTRVVLHFEVKYRRAMGYQSGI